VTRALTVLSERDGAPPLGLLKTTMLQLDSTFDERSFGAGSFRDFTQKLETLGILHVQQGRGGWVVQPADAPPATPAESSSTESPAATPAAEPRPSSTSASAPALLGSPAEGVQAFIRLLKATGVRRWPLYLRNVKQMLRQAAPPLDERTYGFAQVTDLVRAAQRDGFLRVERDRQGVIRVFQGPAFDAATVATSPAARRESDETLPESIPALTEDVPSTEPRTFEEPLDLEPVLSHEVPASVSEASLVDAGIAEVAGAPAESTAPARKRRPNRGSTRRRTPAKK
jgi:hypothetical protein